MNDQWERENDRAPAFPYQGVIVDSPEGVPPGSYVFSPLFSNGLIIDHQLYNGADFGTVARTLSSGNHSADPKWIFNCLVL